MEIHEILAHGIEIGASDVFLIAGLPITFKSNGHQIREGDRLLPEDTEALIRSIYKINGRLDTSTKQQASDDDFAFAIPNVGRFRVNILHQRGTLAAVLRVIQFGLPDPATLGIPEAVLSIANRRNGLVLVTGPAGSGKSTTLACLIDRVNQTRDGHVITIEDPLEYLHHHNKCIVTQREIGIDTPSYLSALRSALRESPDVILLGEMRDKETIEVAMTAAETGELLFSTLHTTSAASSMDRIVDGFPPQQQQQIRVQLSMVLQAVISQQLLPTVDGRLVPAFEIMLANPAIRNLIREGKTHQIDSTIQAGVSQGMQTMDSSIADLCREGIISKETAMRYCVHESTRNRISAMNL